MASGDNEKIEMASNDADLESQEKPCLSVSDSRSTSSIGKKGNPCIRAMVLPVLMLSTLMGRHKTLVNRLFLTLLVLAYLIYFIIALVYDASAAMPLIILTLAVVFIAVYETIFKRCGANIRERLSGFSGSHQNLQRKLGRIFQIVGILICIAFMVWLIVDIIMRQPSQLISLLGLLVIIGICICFSKYPAQINWRPVFWGIILQFILGLLILRTSAGYQVIKFVGDQVAVFMGYTDYGSTFVFGKQFRMHYFAFKVLPMIIFFSTVMNMLYYIGLMQWVIGKIAYLTQVTLGTSAIESAVAVANIFVGMTEAPLVVRPYLSDLTQAEIHSVLTTGLGSIAFSVYGVYVDFGVDGVHLLTACVMSAPAALAVSRMLFPEIEKSKYMDSSHLALTSSDNRNIVEAAAAGASMSIKLVANIGANLIAFLALLAFVNAMLSWFGGFVGVGELSFELICSYLFMPVAFLMGAEWQDCFMVGQLFGIKTFLNEFIAYKEMKPLIANRLAGLPAFDANGTVLHMSERSEVIAIHALCGFCNISSLGIIIGGLSVLMPTRKKELANMAVRALCGGILTCCMTASIAGLLFKETIIVVDPDIVSTAVLGLNTTLG